MVLIQETISIQVWKETILKNFLEKPDENINTFLIYAIVSVLTSDEDKLFNQKIRGFI